jgi:hypothetical protein
VNGELSKLLLISSRSHDLAASSSQLLSLTRCSCDVLTCQSPLIPITAQQTVSLWLLENIRCTGSSVHVPGTCASPWTCGDARWHNHVQTAQNVRINKDNSDIGSPQLCSSALLLPSTCRPSAPSSSSIVLLIDLCLCIPMVLSSLFTLLVTPHHEFLLCHKSDR